MAAATSCARHCSTGRCASGLSHRATVSACLVRPRPYLPIARVLRSWRRRGRHLVPVQRAGSAAPRRGRRARVDASAPWWWLHAGRRWWRPSRAGHAGESRPGVRRPPLLEPTPVRRSCCGGWVRPWAHEDQPMRARLGVLREVVLKVADDVRRDRDGSAASSRLRWAVGTLLPDDVDDGALHAHGACLQVECSRRRAASSPMRRPVQAARRINARQRSSTASTSAWT
jgi:hypothetical protein